MTTRNSGAEAGFGGGTAGTSGSLGDAGDGIEGPVQSGENAIDFI